MLNEVFTCPFYPCNLAIGVQKDLFARHCKWFSSQHSTSIVLSHFCNVLLLLHTFCLFVLLDSRRWTRTIVILVLLEEVTKDRLIVMLINFLSDVHLLIYHKQKNLLHIITLYVGCSKRKWKIINNTQSILLLYAIMTPIIKSLERKGTIFFIHLWPIEKLESL